MQRTSISSDAIRSVGYEAATSILEIELASNEVYQFFHVPLSVYVEFMKAGSKGDFFKHNITPIYEGKKMTEDIA